MGTLDKYKVNLKSAFKSCNSKNTRSKGDRMGWLSLNDLEPVNLEHALTNSEVVKLNKKNSPMLVP